MQRSAQTKWRQRHLPAGDLRRLFGQHRKVCEHVKQLARIPMEQFEFVKGGFGEFELRSFDTVDQQSHDHLIMPITRRRARTAADPATARDHLMRWIAERTSGFYLQRPALSGALALTRGKKLLAN